jgi:hypothetical protein
MPPDFASAGTALEFDTGQIASLDQTPPDMDPIAELASRILIAEGGPGRNPASSAAGYGQFRRGTWLDVFTHAYPDLARKLSAEQILALREVKPLAVDLTRQYARENAESLQRQGLRTSDAVLSLAHAVGSAGAASILAARPTQSVRELLSRDAIIANPQFATMTASGLQSWAADRIAPGLASRSVAGTMTRREGPLPSLSPHEDFPIDGGRMASEVLRTNQAYITQLQQVIEASLSFAAGDSTPSLRRLPPKAGAKSVSDKWASEAVLNTISALVHRPGYERFLLLYKYSQQRGTFSLSVLRDLALVLVSKLQEDNETIRDRARRHAS